MICNYVQRKNFMTGPSCLLTREHRERFDVGHGLPKVCFSGPVADYTCMLLGLKVIYRPVSGIFLLAIDSFYKQYRLNSP